MSQTWIGGLRLARAAYWRGFTLVELLIAMAIIAIALALAAPSFTSTIAGGRVTGHTNDLITALATARNEAIRQGKRITLCRSSDGATCTTAVGSGWEVGWIMFIDTTRSGSNAVVDAGESILSRGTAAPDSVLIRGSGTSANYVSYASDGTTKLIDGSNATDVTIRVCSTSKALADTRRARDVSVNAVGRVMASAPASAVTSTCPSP